MVMSEEEWIKRHEEWLNKKCNCILKPEHRHGEHDWCCQICGGDHVERICPERSNKK